MRKRVFGRKLSRARGARIALFRSLMRQLFLYGQIKTSKAKAKAIQGKVDKIFTLVKRNNLSARRHVLALLGNDRKILDKLFSERLAVIGQRKSGFTRVVRLPRRKGDRAEIVRLELVDKPIVGKKRLVPRSKVTRDENIPTKRKGN